MLAKIKHEVLAIIPPTLFFFVAIGLLMLTKRLMLQQYGIAFSDFAAVVVRLIPLSQVGPYLVFARSPKPDFGRGSGLRRSHRGAFRSRSFSGVAHA